PLKRANNPSINQRKITSINRDLHVGKRVEKAVKQFVEKPHHCWRFTVYAHTIDHIIALLPLCNKLRNKFWWVLEITIQQYDRITGSNIHAAGKGHLRTKIPRMVNANNVFVLLR